MALPKAKRIIHHVEERTMSYRFSDLVDIPENINLEELKQLYPTNIELHGWIGQVDQVVRNIPMEFTNNQFDQEKMRASVLSNLQNVVNNAIEYLGRIENFVAAQEAKRVEEELLQQGIESDPIIGDDAEEVVIEEVRLELPAPEEPVEEIPAEEPVVEEQPVVNARPNKNRRK